MIEINKNSGEFNFREATIESVHMAMKNGTLSCRELIEMYIEQIKNYDKQNATLNAIITLNPKALEIADELDNRFKEDGFVGPLHGIPVLVKDNINTKDMQTTGGSCSLEGVVPSEDAFIVKRLKDKGAIILAKTNLHEFAIWGETISSMLGQTSNPYDLTRTPGGSSGGTGAGIAANFGIIGIGTDTVNSIRSPASACNLVGFKATCGLVSKCGLMPCSSTQDVVGPIMRTVEDTAKVLDVIAGYDISDPTTAWSINNVPRTYTEFLNKDGLRGKRIGILKSFFGKEERHKEINEIIYDGIEDMKQEGAIFVDVSNNIDPDKLVEDISVNLYEFKTQFNIYLEKLAASSEIKSLADVIESGKYHKQIEKKIKLADTLNMDMLAYKERIVKRVEIRNQLAEILASYDLDALVYPHQRQLVVKVGEEQVGRNGALAAITGFPACVVPAGFSQHEANASMGVPVGIEFLAREWDEPILFEIAYAFEQATQHRKPPKDI